MRQFLDALLILLAATGGLAAVAAPLTWLVWRHYLRETYDGVVIRKRTDSCPTLDAVELHCVLQLRPDTGEPIERLVDQQLYERAQVGDRVRKRAGGRPELL